MTVVNLLVWQKNQENKPILLLFWAQEANNYTATPVATYFLHCNDQQGTESSRIRIWLLNIADFL